MLVLSLFFPLTSLAQTTSSQKECPPNQTWAKCGNWDCWKYCRDDFINRTCVLHCAAPGCVCLPGFQRCQESGECLPENECILPSTGSSSTESFSRIPGRGNFSVTTDPSIGRIEGTGGSINSSNGGPQGSNGDLPNSSSGENGSIGGDPSSSNGIQGSGASSAGSSNTIKTDSSGQNSNGTSGGASGWSCPNSSNSTYSQNGGSNSTISGQNSNGGQNISSTTRPSGPQVSNGNSPKTSGQNGPIQGSGENSNGNISSGGNSSNSTKTASSGGSQGSGNSYNKLSTISRASRITTTVDPPSNDPIDPPGNPVDPPLNPTSLTQMIKAAGVTIKRYFLTSRIVHYYTLGSDQPPAGYTEEPGDGYVVSPALYSESIGKQCPELVKQQWYTGQNGYGSTITYIGDANPPQGFTLQGSFYCSPRMGYCGSNFELQRMSKGGLDASYLYPLTLEAQLIQSGAISTVYSKSSAVICFTWN